MKLRRINIRKFRNVSDLVIDIPVGATLVALVGTNGAGKSNVLEIVSAGLSRINVSTAPTLHRGDPLQYPHDIEMTVELTSDPTNYLTLFPKTQHVQVEDEYKEVANVLPISGWDGTITWKTKRDTKDGTPEETFIAGGYTDEGAGLTVAEWLKNNQYHVERIAHLHLDADRSYPPLAFDDATYGKALNEEWDAGWRKKLAASQASPQMYNEWIRYFIAKEVNANNQYMMQWRLARLAGQQIDTPSDHLAVYRGKLQRVLPHIQFVGVDAQLKTIVFRIEANGELVGYQLLSAGEREIAFVLGQIERFGLEDGLLIIDEPELHLNAELVRQWITSLKLSVNNGQVLIATHSLEAVEAVGLEHTFLLERDGEVGKTTSAITLARRPSMNALSRAIGSPAFSLRRKRILYIEGESHTSERLRFTRLLQIEDLVIIEAGNCEEVIKNAENLRKLGEESGEIVRVGGIIDRDFRQQKACNQLLEAREFLHILGVHEVENLLLYPPCLEAIAFAAGRPAIDGCTLIQQVSDTIAGGWIFQYCYANSTILPKPPDDLKQWMWQMSFANLPIDWGAALNTKFPRADLTVISPLAAAFAVAARAYTRLRDEKNWWKRIFGKQCAPKVADALGLSGVDILETFTMKLQLSDPSLVPDALTDAREFVLSI